MKHMNIVKIKVNPAYLNEFKEKAFVSKQFTGNINEYFVQTGNYDFIAVGIWESEQKMIDARPKMLEFLNTIRHTLQELSPELGVTDPASGKIVFENI